MRDTSAAHVYDSGERGPGSAYTQDMNFAGTWVSEETYAGSPTAS
ncbi:MAG: hypothetical protein WD556_08135 [Actinomycetota bacterium]